MCLQSHSAFPFNSLPMELKLKIFIFAAAVLDGSELSHSNRKDLRTRAMKLSFVCREWRDIVWGIPELWSSIYVDYKCHRHNKALFDMYIKYSKNHPLDVSITFNDRLYDIADGSVISGDLIHEAYRLRTLYVSFGRLDRRTYMGEIEMNIHQLVRSHLPLLETACFDHDYSTSRNVLHIDLNGMFHNSPILRDLTISILSINPTSLESCKQVTTLKLQGVSLKLWIVAISRMTNLTHITFNGYKHAETLTINNNSPMIFTNSSLSSIELIIHGLKYRDNSKPFPLRRIACPSLNRLHIRTRDLGRKIYSSLDEESILRDIVTFFRISNHCPLKDFKLEMNQIGSTIWELLDCIHTTLETLHLTSGNTSSEIIPGLIQRLSTPSYLPQITELKISENSSHSDYRTIYRQLRQRTDSWSSGTMMRQLSLIIELYNVIVPDSGSSENNRIVKEEADAEIEDDIKDLKERGIHVSLIIGSTTFNKPDSVQRYEEFLIDF